MALCLIERDYGSYRRSKFYIAGIGIFDLLDYVTTFIYELDPIVHGDILHVQRGFRKLSSDRQTYRHDQNYILVPRRFAGGQLFTCSLYIIRSNTGNTYAKVKTPDRLVLKRSGG